MPPAPAAAIDLGSNTVRLLVAAAGPAGMIELLKRQEATRLGEALGPGLPLLPAAVERTMTVLKAFKSDIKTCQAERNLVGATMAVRQAADGLEFLQRIHDDLDLEAILLTGAQEADLTAAGVISRLSPVPDPALIFDLGGRSTEFILLEEGRVRGATSLEIGAVALTEMFLSSDPPLASEMAALESAVAAGLESGLAGFGPMAENIGPTTLIGTAGTVTTLAAMSQGLREYRAELIDNFRLSRQELLRLLAEMITLPVAERGTLPGLPADRADIIVSGAVVVLEILKRYSVDTLIVSDAGLLEGLWLAAAGLKPLQ